MSKAQMTFEQWIEAIFDQPEQDLIKYEPKPYPSLSPRTQTAYFTRAFENAQQVFAPYSNAQLKQGLYYLASHASEAMFVLLDERIPWADRQRCIRSFSVLFEQLFDKRCSAYLSHNPGDNQHNPLNDVCYMWWDSFPFWGGASHSYIDVEFLAVMKHTLNLKSIACIESALHGLSHLLDYLPVYQDEAVQAIDTFLAQHPDLSDDLKEYAYQAREGAVL